MLVVYGWDKVAGLTEGFTSFIYTMLQRVDMELAQRGAEGVDGREDCWDQGCYGDKLCPVAFRTCI